MKKSVFLSVFGDTPTLKVIDFLIVNKDFDYSMTDIAKLSGIGYSTLKLFWPRFEKESIVRCTRQVGKAKMYQLNFENITVQSLENFYWKITKQEVHRNLKEIEQLQLATA